MGKLILIVLVVVNIFLFSTRNEQTCLCVKSHSVEHKQWRERYHNYYTWSESICDSAICDDTFFNSQMKKQ